jgi:chromosome segregation ATPase
LCKGWVQNYLNILYCLKMDISKLTVQGFKSFYEKSVFTFGKNITAIVGPNGSGKSNITEAVRFVLGEQSTKSMRGKDVTDLLYRGNTAKASKAKVEVEFLKTKNFTVNSENIFIKEMLDKDVVTISRTIYADGKSEYQMNGVEVRVKDLHEFLLYIHLGNKSSWHISQGEADKVLQSNPLERKTIIEDALGLKVYHARINDSQRKLDKTKENIREATLKRREILPELNALSRQVDKIRKGQEFRTDLESKALVFLHHQKKEIQMHHVQEQASDSINTLEQKLAEVDQKLAEKEKNLYKSGGHDTAFLEQELGKEEKVFSFVKNELASLQEKDRNVKNNLNYLEIEENRNLEELKKKESEMANIAMEGNDIIFPENRINEVRDTIELNTEKIINSQNIQDIHKLAEDSDFSFKKLLTVGSVVNKDNVKQISYLQSIKTRIQEKLQSVKSEKNKFDSEIETLKTQVESGELKYKLVTERVELLKKQILEFKYLASETERDLQNLSFERSKLQMKIKEKQEHLNRISILENDLNSEVREFANLLGESFAAKVESYQNEQEMGIEEIQTIKRNIERLKIRLEESQVSNPDEVVANFQEMSQRDAFLLTEISDLENSMVNLEKLISDLKESLKLEFETGLLHINQVFDSYVKRLFGGGGAKVFVVDIESRKKKEDSEEVADANTDEVEEIKTGIDVEVEIPKKKVKGLHSLSGGERALISIALNFSIINQNPAPFMILDETDAALDEANSKRYGEILEMLKQDTKLIVVTHNRETMHFADQVYGITLAKEGHSKVLSVSFEDAVEYAK